MAEGVGYFALDGLGGFGGWHGVGGVRGGFWVGGLRDLGERGEGG